MTRNSLSVWGLGVSDEPALGNIREQWLCRNKVHRNASLVLDIHLQTVKRTDLKCIVPKSPSPQKFPSGLFPVHPLHQQGQPLFWIFPHISLFQNFIWYLSVFFKSDFLSLIYFSAATFHKCSGLANTHLLSQNVQVSGIQARFTSVLRSGGHRAAAQGLLPSSCRWLTESRLRLSASAIHSTVLHSFKANKGRDFIGQVRPTQYNFSFH